MNYDILDSLRSIFADINKNYDNVDLANQSYVLLAQFNNFLAEGQTNSADLSNYLLFIFNKEYGLMKFVTAVYPKQTFQKPVVQALDILHVLTQNFPKKLEKYFQEVSYVCLKILRGFSSGSEAKVKTLQLLKLLFEKVTHSIEYTKQYLEIYRTLQSCLEYKTGTLVSERLYECLGLYAKYFDFTLNNEEQNKLKNVFYLRIKENMSLGIKNPQKNDYSKSLVTGLFTGLRNLCKTIPLNAEIEKNKIEDLYQYVKILVESALQNRIKTASRAALLFLNENVIIFSDNVFKDHTFWHCTLVKWLAINSEDQIVASNALVTIHKTIADKLATKNISEHKSIFRKYLVTFRNGLDNPSATSVEKHVHIRGIELFFRAAPVLLTQTEASNFAIKLIYLFKSRYENNDQNESVDWSLLPDYVRMLASLVRATGNREMALLRQSVVTMLVNYPLVPNLRKSAVVDAFLMTLCASDDGTVEFDRFVGELIHQAVVWSCSHCHVTEVAADTDDEKIITVRSYFPFWRSVLDLQSFEHRDLDMEKKNRLLVLIAGKLIIALFACVAKLNVTLSRKRADADACASATNLRDAFEVDVKDDFVVFLNVVDFYEGVLAMIRPNLLTRCVYRLVNFFVEKSAEYPMVSGFYRLLTACLRIANEIDYFEAAEVENDPTRQECLQTLAIHVETICKKRLCDFEGELLISCLKSLMECPPQAVAPALPACVSGFICVFTTIGRNYLPVAEAGVETLEKWQRSLPREEMQQFLEQVVPAMDDFVRSRSLAYMVLEPIQRKTKTKRALSKRKMALEIEPELLKLQRKIVKFLGRQSGTVCAKLIAVNSGGRADEVWGSECRLKVELPPGSSGDRKVKVELYLDKLVPRTVELASRCTDRRTRVTACELLHALVLLFLGTANQMPDKSKSEIENLMRKFSFAILELGCDPDEVVRQLFEPLAYQMIHWYSSPMQYGKCHTAVMIDALMEGITSPTDANLRSFSGKCVAEFIKWTIKQSTETGLVQNPVNVKALVKKMRYFSSHPDDFKKLGAALIFNNTYAIIREERCLVDTFWLEILEIFVSSLDATTSNLNEAVLVQIFDALKHLQRVLTEKSHVFNRTNESRRKPAGFSGTKLADAVEFTLRHVRSRSATCREKCAEMFFDLVPLVADANTPLKFFETLKIEPDKWFRDNFEGYLDDFTTLESFEKFEISQLLFWLTELERAIDGLIFLLKSDCWRLLDMDKVTSVISVKYYVTYVFETDLKGALNLMNEQDWMATAHDRKSFKERKDALTDKVLRLCCSLLSNGCSDISLWNRQLWMLVTKLTFSPSEKRVVENLKHFFKASMQFLQFDKVEELIGCLKKHISDYFLSNYVDADRTRRCCLDGLLILQNSELNGAFRWNALFPDMIQGVLARFSRTLSMTSSSSLDIDGVQVDYYAKIFEFCLKDDDDEAQLKTLVEFMYVAENVDQNGAQTVPFGLYLLNSFDRTLVPVLARRCHTFFSLAVEKGEKTECTVSFLKKILSYLNGFRKMTRHLHGSFVECLCDNWAFLDGYFEMSQKNLSDGVDLMRMVNALGKSKFVTNWLIALVLKASAVEENTLDYRLEVLEVFFENFTAGEDVDCTPIKAALDDILDKIKKTPDKNTQNVSMMKVGKLFAVIQKTTSPLLIQFIMKAHLIFPDNLDHSKDTGMVGKFLTNIDEMGQLETMELCQDILKDKQYPAERRTRLASSILVVVFQSVTLKVFERFFVKHVRSMLAILEEKSTEDNLPEKILTFLLVELLFARVAVEENNEINKEMRMAAYGGKESDRKDLLKSFLKFALNTFREQVSVQNKELLRIYRCFSYNALVSIATNSLNDSKFHVKLFARLENDVDILWSGLVDLDKTFKFKKDFDVLPQKRKTLVNIRRKKREDENENEQDEAGESIRSQRIFSSSLGEDITRHDMSNVILRSLSQAQARKELKDNDRTSCLTEVALDRTDVNGHECMATVCGLINHLVNVHLSECGEEVDDLPECFKGLRYVLMNESTPKNVRIFLIQAIENTSNAFSHLSKWFFAPVIKFILDGCVGNDLNFFVTDLIVMLANWSEKAVPQDETENQLATKLIEFLFEKISLERRDVFKFDIQLIKILLEAWRNFVKIPAHFLKRVENSREETAKEIEVHLTSLLLINDLFVFDDGNEIVFLKFLVGQLNSSKKLEYVACAETIGLMLKKWKQKVSEGLIDIFDVDIIESTLKKIWNSDTDKGANILEGITIQYPEYVEEQHVIRLLSRLGNVASLSQHVFLKVITRGLPVLRNVFEFRCENWTKYLNSESTEVQITTMNLMKETLDILKESDTYRGIVGAICEKRNSQNELCKSLSYDISMKIYEATLSEGQCDVEMIGDVVDMCKTSLIEGLGENDPELVERLRRFWFDSGILSDLLEDRFLETIELFYRARSEECVLGNGICFLLGPLRQSEDFERVLFDYPLEDCAFENYELSVSASYRHPYDVPMFAETFLDNSSTLSSRKPHLADRFADGELRATQATYDLSFAPTRENNDALRRCLSSQSSLMVGTEETWAGGVDDEEGFKDPNVMKTAECKVFKRRFLRDKTKISEICANHEVKERVKRIEKRKIVAKERDRKVCISRKYRKGDFPDIQIPLSSIVVPLQLLASENSDIAKTIYVAVLSNLKEKFDRDPERYWSRLEKITKDIFSSSLKFDTNIFRTLLDFVIVSDSRIRIDPRLLTECCLSSGLVSTGTLIIENYLMNVDEAHASKRFKGVGADGLETILWIKLAELYREMSEWDVVCSIFEEKVECDGETVKKAIMNESSKRWAHAQDLYRHLIENDLATTLDKKDFYYEAYFRCFANLGQWEELAKAIENMETPDLDYWDALWDDDWKRKRLLPWFMNAKVNEMLFNNTPSEAFFERLNRSLSESNKAEHLKLTFPRHLSTLWIMNGDSDAAQVYLSSFLDVFLAKWQILEPVFATVRARQLRKLRAFSNAHELLEVVGDIGSGSAEELEKTFANLRVIWSGLGDEGENMVELEGWVLCQRLFAGLIDSKIRSFQDPDSEIHLKELENAKFRMDLGIVEAALKENNFYMARKYCKEHRNKKEMALYIAKMMYVKAASLNDPSKAIKDMLRSVEMINDNVLKSANGTSDHALSALMTCFEIFEEISRITANNLQLLEENSAQISKITGSISIRNGENLTDYATSKIINFLGNRTDRENDENTKDVANAYVKLAYYFNEKENSAENSSDLSVSVLRGMKMGSKEARQLFPCLLQQENLGTSRREVFVRESSSVPTWMFLDWMPQLLANLNSDNIYAIESIVLRIAETYPQAMMYPYRLSKENFKPNNECLRSLINKLDKLLLFEDVDLFLKALGNVSVPETILKYYGRKMLIYAHAEDFGQIKNVYDFLLTSIFDQEPDSSDPSKLQGNAFKKLRGYKKILEKMKCDNKIAVIKKIQELFGALGDSPNQSALLKDYCPWLAHFSSTNFPFDLEIPGQYGGGSCRSPPLPRHHVKVRKFKPNVFVMQSKQKPIKLTILGADTKEYSYLVKFGEDVRQDQRLEQMFKLVNEAFGRRFGDGGQMALATFEVIPLTSSLGLIEWVDKTEKLEDFMKMGLKDKKRPRSYFPSGPFKKYTSFFYTAARGVKSMKDAFGKSAKFHDRNKVIANYRGFVNEMEANVLRKAFWEISATTESFVGLRHNFVRSYGALCAAHWLMGIGDRHLSNTLMFTEDGRCIGIDFGLAFGTATQALEVPELMPFRLTPQLVQFMEPFDEKGGFFRTSMIQAVKCLRESKRLLLATMSVFIKEPSIDWLEKCKKEESCDENTESESADWWYPVKKIDQSRRKLEGVNPAYVTVEDLKENKTCAEYADAYCDLVRGVAEHNFRARVGKIDGLTVEEQVDCLIDQAVDYNLLGRTYAGWCPWV